MATPRRSNSAVVKKSPTPVHEAFAAYIEKTTGHTVPVGDVALVQRLYPLYLKSPAVVKAKEAEAERKAEEAARKKAEKDARLRERLAKIEEQRQALLSALNIEDEQESKEGGTVMPFPKPKAVEPVEDEDEDDEPEVLVLSAEDEFEEADEDSDDEDEDEWDTDDDDEEDF